MKKSDARRMALTLVEMVVVMAICMVLAALLIPLLLRTRENARMITCKNNLGTIGVAFSTMLAGERGYISSAYYDVANLRDGKWWIGARSVWNAPDPLIGEHVTDSFLCPSGETRYNFIASARDGVAKTVTTSYAHNVEMPIIASNISRVGEPVNRVILYDGDPYAVLGLWEHSLNWAEKTVVRRHRGEANFLFLDGHVENRGDFRAEPFHGCPLGLTPMAGNTAITDGPERPGLNSSWIVLAGVELHPESNNIKNNGNTVQCKLTFSAGLPATVSLSTIYLVGAANKPFKHPLPAIGPMHTSKDTDGSTVCQFKFDRQRLYDQLRAGNHFGQQVPMKIVGELTNGRPFEGMDASCVFYPPEEKK